MEPPETERAFIYTRIMQGLHRWKAAGMIHADKLEEALHDAATEQTERVLAALHQNKPFYHQLKATGHFLEHVRNLIERVLDPSSVYSGRRSTSLAPNARFSLA